MPITPPPATPSRTNPATFSPRMDATLAWFPVFVDEFNTDLPLLGRMFVTYGGTANAITLTGALPPRASTTPIGAQVRFRATAANTGATTINLDGRGAVACRTITGVALPSGYIRTDVDTVATFDGTYWVLDREIERGSNANGAFVRLADGTQICQSPDYTHDATTASGNVFTSGSQTWTYPAAFASGTVVSASGATNDVRCWIPGNSGVSTNFLYAIMSSVSVSARVARLFALGRWY